MTKPPEQQQQAQQQQQRQAAAVPCEIDTLVEARTRELSALSSHLQGLAEKEKSQLARTLHDELGGLLTAAKMDLSWLQSRVDTPAHQERLAQLGSVLDEAMSLKRRVERRPAPVAVGSLRPGDGAARLCRLDVYKSGRHRGYPAAR
jgi:signal transduction histidine kinase